MASLDNHNPKILGYDLDGEPQVIDRSTFWQILIYATSKDKRADLLRQLLQHDFYNDPPNKIFIQNPQDADDKLKWALDEMNDRYDIMAEDRVQYDPYLIQKGRMPYLVIINEPTSWQPDFYSKYEETFRDILFKCGRAGFSIILVDDQHNIPPYVYAYSTTKIASL